MHKKPPGETYKTLYLGLLGGLMFSRFSLRYLYVKLTFQVIMKSVIDHTLENIEIDVYELECYLRSQNY